MLILNRWFNGCPIPRAGITVPLAALVILAGQLYAAEAAESGDDGRGILRYDIMNDRLAPISPEELRPGYIYSHFSERLHRRVWTYLQADGQFWHAFGEGTTQPAWRFDIRATLDEAMEKLKQINPEMSDQLRRKGGLVFVKLTADGDWAITRTASQPSVYNAETGQLWQWINTKYVPVITLQGDRWVVREGKYVPAGRLHQCGCYSDVAFENLKTSCCY
jgi:hypothetical protein